MKKNKFRFVHGLLIFSGLLFIASMIFSNQLLGPENIFYMWTEYVNSVFLRNVLELIPSFIKAFNLIFISIVIYYVLKLIFSKTLNKSKKQVTVKKMLVNFLRYVAWIVDILLALSIFGVNSAALVTSAGVLSLVVGLGAQSLIADIIAGITIIFDDQFEVGDIVTIDDFRGTVEEIGIRTTKIVDWKGRIKVVNNSKIATIINEAKNKTYASVSIDVDYDTDITYLEKVLKDNLDKVSKKIPNILENIEYKGINNLGSSALELLFIAKTTFEDVFTVQRAMNKELKILLTENNINIPFTQVTISNR